MIDFINNNLNLILSILGTILTAIGGYIAKLYKKYINDKQKKQIVEDTVKYVEQITKDISISSENKFKKCKTKAIEWLNSKNIKFSDTELEVLIESAVNGFNNSINKK